MNSHLFFFVENFAQFFIGFAIVVLVLAAMQGMPAAAVILSLKQGAIAAGVWATVATGVRASVTALAEWKLRKLEAEIPCYSSQ